MVNNGKQVINITRFFLLIFQIIIHQVQWLFSFLCISAKVHEIDYDDASKGQVHISEHAMGQ